MQLLLDLHHTRSGNSCITLKCACGCRVVVTHLGGFINDTVADGYTHQVDTNHIRSSETEEGRGRGREERGRERAKVGEEKR